VTPRSSAPPDAIEALADERARARTGRDYARADALRAEIEGAGWRIVDQGTAYHLEPVASPTIEEVGVVRYGSAVAVPSVLEMPATAPVTVLLLADEWPADLARTLGGIRAHGPAGTHVVIVANSPSPTQAAGLASGSPDLDPVAGAVPEVLWTSARLGHAAAMNAGLRRARGAIVILADTSVEPTGDALTPLVDALAAPGVAVAGAFGVVAPDLRHFGEATGPDPDAIEGGWLAFRREDLLALGPLDEKFVVDRHLDIWWSLVLRAGLDLAQPPRRALRLDLPLVRHERRDSSALPEAERDRLSRRNSYRLLERFRGRTDLLSGPPAR
jgi:hypothetical protein